MLSCVWRHHHGDQLLLRRRKLDSLINVLSLAGTAFDVLHMSLAQPEEFLPSASSTGVQYG